ncbi:E3 ubiquitin-protein ligase SINAT2 [Acorus calamus]|uniref:E3 ubiquitin-protein ligase SINAT2 n=1 Tax=Acorus calamus TaxID=4465 RepID=A0AAV9EFP8_ACOCL|nr:E3 ubiquitin-protein ligase SINAT2 [Acorus calamus]
MVEELSNLELAFPNLMSRTWKMLRKLKLSSIVVLHALDDKRMLNNLASISKETSRVASLVHGDPSSKAGTSSINGVHELLECPICTNLMYPLILQEWSHKAWDEAHPSTELSFPFA